jgi:hypothetical protein
LNALQHVTLHILCSAVLARFQPPAVFSKFFAAALQGAHHHKPRVPRAVHTALQRPCHLSKPLLAAAFVNLQTTACHLTEILLNLAKTLLAAAFVNPAAALQGAHHHKPRAPRHCNPSKPSQPCALASF